MSRPRRDYLSQTASDLASWASWVLRFMPTSAIGHRSCTAEASAGQGRSENRPGSSDPCLMMPKDVQRVDTALRDIPADLYKPIEDKYFIGRNVSRYRLDQSLIWISARIR